MLILLDHLPVVLSVRSILDQRLSSLTSKEVQAYNLPAILPVSMEFPQAA
jgi:hypothetical protein